MKKLLAIVIIVMLTLGIGGCAEDQSATHKEAQQAEQLQQESIAQSGTPAIQQFREKKLLKDIYELRDQDGLVTYTYIVAENTGKLIFFGETIGYGIPAATQYNNPQKTVGYQGHEVAISQAEPNGLYSPATAEGTWVMLKDPNGKSVKPVYIEPRIIVSPFKLPE